MLLFMGAMPGHLCFAGEPVLQPLIGALCLMTVGICVAKIRIIILLDILLFASSIALSSQYINLVHTPNLTGNPRVSKMHEEVL